MKVVYVAGPYRADTINGIHDNIERARQVALKYWRWGYAVICPHMNTAMMDGACKDKVWLDGDIELMKRADVVVMMQRWELSLGAIEEHGVAVIYNKEIIYDEAEETAKNTSVSASDNQA